MIVKVQCSNLLAIAVLEILPSTQLMYLMPATWNKRPYDSIQSAVTCWMEKEDNQDVKTTNDITTNRFWSNWKYVYRFVWMVQERKYWGRKVSIQYNSITLLIITKVKLIGTNSSIVNYHLHVYGYSYKEQQTQRTERQEKIIFWVLQLWKFYYWWLLNYAN